jgi:hypothetical protein
MAQSSEQQLKAMLDSLVKAAEDERTKSDRYKDLFKGSMDVESLLRSTEHAMIQAVLDATSVLKTKMGYERISDEAWYMLLALPFLTNTLEKHIEDTQGFACSVDKVYYHIAHNLEKALEQGEK